MVSSMPNRFCSVPRLTTSQDESTSARMVAAAAGTLTASTAAASARPNWPAKQLSIGSIRRAAGSSRS